MLPSLFFFTKPYIVFILYCMQKYTHTHTHLHTQTHTHTHMSPPTVCLSYNHNIIKSRRVKILLYSSVSLHQGILYLSTFVCLSLNSLKPSSRLISFTFRNKVIKIMMFVCLFVLKEWYSCEKIA